MRKTPKNSPKFGLLVRQKRLNAGQATRVAAKAIGMDFTYLNRIEHGDMPALDVFCKICRYYGIDRKKGLDLLV